MTIANKDRCRLDADKTAIVESVLRQRFPDRVFTSAALREQHANSASWIASQPPDIVVFVSETAEVATIAQICSQYDSPMIAFGAGSSLEGHVNAPFGGVCIDLSMMNKVLRVNVEDLDVVVQPGITRERLNAHLRDTGLHFPIDPGADASIGGMVSTRASGTNAVRYGTMAENVVALECVLADGSVFRTASRAPKSAAGYDLTRLFVGAEGTLGIVTEVTLKLRGIPEHYTSGYCQFPSVKDACTAVIETIQCGLDIGRIELMDAQQIRACNAYSKLELPEKPTLFLEFSGDRTTVEGHVESFVDLAEVHGATASEFASVAEERNRLWKARHDAYWAAKMLRPGTQSLVTDACVPISLLAKCIEETREDVEAEGFSATILGHVGDGNFHVIINVNMDDADEKRRVQAFIERLADRAISVEGTCTGEHGIGQGKKNALARELGPALPVMAAIKRALDPNDIMNPGKIF